MSRLILLSFLLFASAPVVADDPAFVGSFTTVSESECNVEMTLMYDGSGVLVDTCRIEDGTRINSNKMFNISWRQQNGLIMVDIDGDEEPFVYHEKLSCAPLGQQGSSDGLVGYGIQLWRYPMKCK